MSKKNPNPPKEDQKPAADGTADDTASVQAKAQPETTRVQPLRSAGGPIDPHKAQPISVGRFGLAEEMRAVFAITPVLGTEPEDMLDEGYWRHIGHLLRVGAKIEARSEDNRWYAEFLVVGCGKLYAKVQPLHPVVWWDTVEDPGRMESLARAGYSTKFLGHKGWAAMRESNQLKDGFQTEGDAARWLNTHMDTVFRGQEKKATL